MKRIEDFIDKLATFPANELTFNVYAGDTDESEIRRHNLRLYLHRMLGKKPEIMLVGEAPGFHGCRFTGLPFTSERQLTDEKHALCGPRFGYRIINLPENAKHEGSAHLMWSVLSEIKCALPLIWNIYPFHPHLPGKPEKNRTPYAAEIKAGIEFTRVLLEIFQIQKIGAVGRKSQNILTKYYGDKVGYIRHPANGGARLFREHLTEFMGTAGL